MISVVLLGTGNLGTHLLSALSEAKNVTVKQVYGRNESAVKRIVKDIPHTTKLNQLVEADIYLIAISDDQITRLSSQLPRKNALIVHTSGTQAIDALAPHIRTGIFYPLQTFSKGTEIDFRKVPICLEVQDEKDYQLLQTLAESISEKVVSANSIQRKKLHLAAVFVNNFSNHLYHLGAEICEANELPFELLHPLIEETALKIKRMTPFAAQTGPAKRNDQQTIDQQKLQLTEIPLELYRLFTESIKKTYE